MQGLCLRPTAKVPWLNYQNLNRLLRELQLVGSSCQVVYMLS
jgi:hypothetical protein